MIREKVQEHCYRAIGPRRASANLRLAAPGGMLTRAGTHRRPQRADGSAIGALPSVGVKREMHPALGEREPQVEGRIRLPRCENFA